MNRFHTILLTWAFLSWPKVQSIGQETTVSDQLAEICPLSGEILLLRAQSKKPDKVTQALKISPLDRVGTAGGSPGRISIDAGCMVTLKGVLANEGEGLSVERAGKTLKVRLHHGRVLVETFAVDLALDTPHGHVEGKSVYFLAEVGRDSTRIVVVDGELKVSNDLGRLDLASGETVALRKGIEPAKGPPADPDKDLAGVAAAEEPFNLIKNPGFELDLKEWCTLRYANKPLATIDDMIVHGGKKSVRIQLPSISLAPPIVPNDAAGNGNTAFYMLQDCKVLKPGGRYLLRLWIRTENYAVDGKPVPFSFLSRGLVLPDQLIGDGVSVCTCPPAEKKWTCARFVFEARPRSEKDQFGISLPDGPSERGVFSGTVWLDDFFLAPLAVKRARVINFQSAEQVRLFVTSGGSWRVENNELIGTCPGETQWATYNTAFSSISQVTVRARIVPPAQHNLRLWVGPIHVIFNWNGADRDSYRNGAAFTDKPTSAVKPGKEYEISVKQQGSKVVVAIDGMAQWEAEATLSGTVSLQAALESTIGVRQLTIEGTPDFTRTVIAENRQTP